MDLGPDRLRAFPTFKNVSAADLEELTRHLYGRRVRRGEVLYAEGDDATEAALLLSGRLAVTLETPQGPRPIGDLWPGDLVGEAALFDRNGVRNATVRAVMDSECAVLDQDTLIHLPCNRAVLALEQQLLSLMAKRIRAANHRIEATWRPPAPTARREAPGSSGSGGHGGGSHAPATESIGHAILRILGVG